MKRPIQCAIEGYLSKRGGSWPLSTARCIAYVRLMVPDTTIDDHSLATLIADIAIERGLDVAFDHVP